jgi:hypothetical protein
MPVPRHQGERPHYLQSQYNGPHKYNQYFYVRTGIIEEVDVDKYEMTVRWTGNQGVHTKVPISFPYAGPAGHIGGLPEKGAMGIFGFINDGGGKGSPLLLTYLMAGLDAKLNYNTVQVFPDAISTSDINQVDFKLRKMNPGDMVVSSPLGGLVFLNNSVEFHDNAQDSILIREDDQLIISTSLNNYVFTDGVSISSGPALRNGLLIYDSDGNKIDNNGAIQSLSGGKDNIYIVPYGNPIDSDTQYYSEYRVDVDDLVDGRLDLNDINSSSPLSTRDPIVSLSMGNLIGADKRNIQLYGMLLKARLFASASDKRGNFALERAIETNGVDEPGILGMAYALQFKSGAFIGVDKEGHYNVNLPASSANPLGAGRSMSVLAQGSLKEIWGASSDNFNSWDLSTTGGVIWDLGAHNYTEKERSLEITTAKGISIQVKSGDTDGFALNESYRGDVFQTVLGNKVQSSINLSLVITGLKTEQIGGSVTESVQSDKSVSVAGVYSETVVKEMQGKFGVRKTTITTGNDELTVLAGNISETIATFGKRSTLVTAGSIEETVLTGSYKTTVGAGSYTISVGTGTISISSTVGTVSMSGTAVTITGNLAVQVNAPIVQLGNGALIGGVVSGLPGIPTHFDYVTGLPLKGSLKVSVG